MPMDADTNNGVPDNGGGGRRDQHGHAAGDGDGADVDEMGRVTFWRDGADATDAAIMVGNDARRGGG